MTDLDQQLETKIRTDERQRVADRIAHDLAVKVCAPDCDHPSCATYRYAASTARRHGNQPVTIPTQPGSPE